MALASGVTLEIEAARVRFLPGALEYARAGAVPGGLQEQSRVRLLRGGGARRELPREIEDLLYDPQTSGGLLIALPEADAAALERRARGRVPHRPRAAARQQKADSPDMNDNPIIVALDVETAAEARALVRASAATSAFTRSGWSCTPPPAWRLCAN